MTDQTKSSAEMGAELDAALESLEQRTETGEEGEPNGRAARRGFSGLLALFLSIVSLCVAGYAGFEVYRLLGRVEQQDQRYTEIAGSIASTNDSVSRLDGDQGNLADLQTRLATSVEDRLNGLSRELAVRSNTSSQDWILAEVEYLIRLANQRLLVERQVNGAISLLASADDLIRQADIVSAYPVRQALARDIARLKAAGTVDRDGLYLKLAALTGQVDELKRRSLVYESRAADESVAAEEPTVESSWSQKLASGLARVGDRFAGLVDYKEGVERVAPILPPAEEYYLRQNLKLKLQTAQLALLKQHQASYDQSLRDSARWVTAHFDGDDGLTLAMAEGLEELAHERVETEIPDISGSTAAIRGYMSNFHTADGPGAEKAAEIIQ